MQAFLCVHEMYRDRTFTREGVNSRVQFAARMCMRALITVERHRSTPSSYLVGPHAVVLLESLPGISEVRVEHEGIYRAVLSYRWKDPGIHSPGIEAALLAKGMQLV